MLAANPTTNLRCVHSCLSGHTSVLKVALSHEKALFWIISPSDASQSRWETDGVVGFSPTLSHRSGSHNQPPQPVTQGPECRVEPSAHAEEFNGTKHTFKTSASQLAEMRAVLVRVWCWQQCVWCKDIFRTAFKNLALAPPASFSQRRAHIGTHTHAHSEARKHADDFQRDIYCVFSPHLQSCLSSFVLLRSLSQRHLSGSLLTEIPQRVGLLSRLSPAVLSFIVHLLLRFV